MPPVGADFAAKPSTDLVPKLHTTAYYKSITPATTTQDVDIVTDGVFSRASASGLYVPAGMNLVAAQAIAPVSGSGLPRMRVTAPSLLRIGYPYMRPMEGSPGATDPNFQVLLDRPVGFPNNEVVGIDVAWNAIVAGAKDIYAILFFRGANAALPPGDGFWIRGYSTTAITTTKSWVAVSPTWDITLPEGNYAVVGFEHVSDTGAVAARLVFPGSPWRPGTISIGPTARTHAAFYEGQFGVFGTFAAFAPPSFEVLVSAANTYQEFYLRVVKL